MRDSFTLFLQMNIIPYVLRSVRERPTNMICGLCSYLFDKALFILDVMVFSTEVVWNELWTNDKVAGEGFSSPFTDYFLYYSALALDSFSLSGGANSSLSAAAPGTC